MLNEKTIWIIEDDPGCQFVYQETLSIRYRSRMFSDLSEFNGELIETSIRPDLIIADLRMPGGTFLEFLSSSLASKISGIPLIVVSSLDDIDALRFCFKKGARDYITKPFGKSELIVKVERILGQGVIASSSYFQINTASCTVELDGAKSSTLTAKELRIVSLLQEAPNGFVSRDELETKVWPKDSVGEKTLGVHLTNLRKKLAPLGVDVGFHESNGYYLSTNGMH